MPSQSEIVVQPPLGGVVRTFAYQNQQPFTSPDLLNKWPVEWSTGRARLGTRAGLTSTGLTLSGAPYNSCEATFVNSSTTYRAVAIVHAGGTRIFYTLAGVVTLFGGGDFITDDPGTDFADCAVFLQSLIQVRGGGTALYRVLSGSAGAGGPISGHAGYAGTTPTNCGIAEAHGNRIYFAGDTANPHVMYAARIETFWDWDFAQTDAAAAWASNSNTGASGVGEPITALLSHTRDCLLVGCTDSLYVLRGDPTAGGEMERLSPSVGPLMNAAWCHDGMGRCWMMTRNGLYMMPPGCGDFPQPMSLDKLPIELRDVNPANTDYVSLAYDQKFNGLHIYIDYNSGTDQHWFYDLGGGGFFPMSFGTTQRLGVTLKSAKTSTKSALLAITAAGAISQFDTASSESITSYEVRGPIMHAPGEREGKLVDLDATLAEDSGSALCTVYSGDSPAEAYSNLVNNVDPFICLTWTRGTSPVRLTQYRDHPSKSGRCSYLKIASVSQSLFAVEGIRATRAYAAQRRVGG